MHGRDVLRPRRDADGALDVRLDERGLRLDAEHEVGPRERFVRAVVPVEAFEKLRGLECATLVERDREEVVCADEAGEVDDAY